MAVDEDVDGVLGEPVELYADGMRVATGRLLVDEDGVLALRVEQIVGAEPGPGSPVTTPQQEVAA